MEAVFAYIISLGAAVMMPIIFLVLGLCIGLGFNKSMMSGLKVGVGFVGLGIVTALLTSSMTDPLQAITDIYHLQLKVFDMGWPTAASVAYNTAVGAFIIPVCLGVNILLLLCKGTRTVNIDLWNYWHFAFIGAVVYFAMDSMAWGFFAAIICYIVTLVIADVTAPKFQSFYKDVDGISIPQPFCAGFVPFAWGINKLLDKIACKKKSKIDGGELIIRSGIAGLPPFLRIIVGVFIILRKKFGIIGEPLFLGIIVGVIIGCFAQGLNGQNIVDNIPGILMLGVKMGAVMELIPRVTVLFIEGLKPICDATRSLVARKFKGAEGLSIGMSPALVIGHPTTLAASTILIPISLVVAVLIPGNQFLPLASLAGMFYIFPLVLPYTKGNLLKTIIVGIVVVVLALFMVTYLAPYFTAAAHDVAAAHPEDAALQVPAGFEAGSLDFAGSPFSLVIFWCVDNLKWIGAGVLTLLTAGLVWWNRRRMLRLVPAELARDERIVAREEAKKNKR